MDRDIARALSRNVESRLLSAPPPPLPAEPGDLFKQIRTALLSASDENILRSAPHDVMRRLHMQGGQGEVVLIHGGETFDKGQPEGRFFDFSDGSRLSFGCTIDYRAASPSLLAYRFHLRFPPGGRPAFLRLDLNPEPKENSLVEPRCHIHPGVEEVRLPAPLMSPLEILGILLFGGIAT